MKYVVTLVVGAVIGAIVGALWIGPERVEVSSLSEEDVATIRATIESVVQTTVAKDWAAWESNWAEDAVTMYAHSPIIEGRAAVRESWEGTNMTEFVATPLVIEGRDGLAYARGTYSLSVEMEEMPEPVSDSGKFLLILEKQPDGSWAVAIDAASSDLPLP
jgi:ketosteroid isomerase-like protein